MAKQIHPEEMITKAFPGIQEAEARKMAQSGEIHFYPAKYILCREGAEEDTFYIILDGEVRVTKLIDATEVRELSILGPGGFFGEMALIHNAPRAATVTTRSPVTVLEIYRDVFQDLMQDYSSMSMAMVREVSRRLRENDEMAIEDLRAKAKELALAYQQLAEQDYARHEFLTTIAHELRTPLTAVHGYLQAMKGGMLTGDSLTDAYAVVERHLQVIIRLVNDILFLQEMDLLLLDFQLVDLGELAIEVIAQAEQKARDAGIKFVVDRERGIPLVRADVRGIERVLKVLVDNAIKFSPDGGEVRITMGSRDDEVWLAVQDHGVGIPDEARPRLFRRFFRLDEVGGHLFSGAGLGLSIASQVMERHGGRIDVQSRLGEGSTFTIYFKPDMTQTDSAQE